MKTANPVVRMVPQMSGHAPSWKSADVGLAPVLTWLPIWTSTSPLPVNHYRPLCWNDGHARTATKTIISTITSRTTDASAPSVRSARRSDHGSLSRSSIYLSGTQCVWTTFCALLEVCAQWMNFCRALATRGCPRVTIQKLRTPPYSPDLAAARVQPTPW